MKKALLDASSAILLFKADLFARLTDFYHVSLTPSVLHELTRKNHEGADTFYTCALEKKISVIAMHNVPLPDSETCPALRALDQGELETIKWFMAGGQDFIITDDGRAARYCSRNDIAFINALLFPRLLYFSSSISLEECNAAMDRLIRLGRYSAEVIERAKNCKKEYLLFAITGSCGE